ncbi:asparaginase [Haloparvum sedimenti]|uniref:asparaginase n=1 Tax=Haloparvum sedimenti TaxID=1678448 RepID=UPI0009B5CB28|nr:asparaginase [Haloparvum sedimenti]
MSDTVDDGDPDDNPGDDPNDAPGDGHPTVAVLACGGTIASEPDDDGAAPAKAGEELVEAVPALADHARVEAREVCGQPGFDMRWRDVLATADAAREAVADDGSAGETGADGVVVTHGTDTLADTAFALDLLTDLPVPVVVTGAQRRLDEPSSDVPANLTTAVRAAADERYAPGVHVAFDDELHAAREAIKGHTNALSTFRSPNGGPVAEFTRAAVRVHREPARRVDAPPLDLGAADADAVPEVPVVQSGTGVGAAGLERALAAESVEAVVIEGTGLGNATGALGDAVGEALGSENPVPVVVSSRSPAGPTEPVYGTPGGAVTLADHGVTFADDLPAAKARIAVALGFAAGRSGDALADLLTAPPRV